MEAGAIFRSVINRPSMDGYMDGHNIYAVTGFAICLLTFSIISIWS